MKTGMTYICSTCWAEASTNADYEKHMDICQPDRVRMTDRKNIKVGDQWFDMILCDEGWEESGDSRLPSKGL